MVNVYTHHRKVPHHALVKEQWRHHCCRSLPERKRSTEFLSSTPGGGDCATGVYSEDNSIKIKMGSECVAPHTALEGRCSKRRGGGVVSQQSDTPKPTQKMALYASNLYAEEVEASRHLGSLSRQPGPRQ